MSPTGWSLVEMLTRPTAMWWWGGPMVMVWAWIVVPIQRIRHNVLSYDEQTKAARFWWAPGWGFLGITGLGLALIASPLLDPRFAAQFEFADWIWVGLRMTISPATMPLLVGIGAVLCLKGLLLYANAWSRDRRLRWMAWRWRMANRQRPQEPDEEGSEER